MLPDFEIIQRRFKDNPDIQIVPISDVHLGAREFSEERWIKFIETVKDTPNMYIILGGDLINNSTRNSVSNIFDERMRPSDQKKLMVNYLVPIRDRILCSVTGNHERRSGKDADDDPCYDIMAKLDLEHLHRENIAFLKIQMGRARACGTRNPTYTIAVTHGSGGGILSGAAINRNERFGYTIDGADALIVGHTHKPMVSQPGKLVIDKQHNTVSVRPFKVIVSTSWLDYGGYAAQKMLLPSSFALQTIELKGTTKEIIVSM